MKKLLLFTLVTLLISNIGYAQSKKSDIVSESSNVSKQTSSLEVKYNTPLNDKGLTTNFNENAIIPTD